MDIRDIQEQARKLREDNGWDYITIEQRLIFLVSEVGELSREVLNLSGAYGDSDVKQARENIGLEMYDVIMNVCELANLYGIDLEDAFVKKADLNRMRKW